MEFINHIELLPVQDSLICYISLLLAFVFLLISIIILGYGIYLYRCGTSGYSYLHISKEALEKRKYRSNMIYIKAAFVLILSIAFMVLFYKVYNQV